MAVDGQALLLWSSLSHPVEIERALHENLILSRR